MGFTNYSPTLERIVRDLTARVRHLERSKRYTMVARNGMGNFPKFPQSGDICVDTLTGIPYVFIIDGNTTLTASLTVVAGTNTITVAERRGFKPGQSIRIQSGTAPKNNYWAQITTSYVATTGAGTITVTFPTITNPMTNPFGTPATWTAPSVSTVFPATTSIVQGSSWRQLVLASDLQAKGVLGAAAAAGGNSADGSNTGGIGEVVAPGYTPNNQTSSM